MDFSGACLAATAPWQKFLSVHAIDTTATTKLIWSYWYEWSSQFLPWNTWVFPPWCNTCISLVGWPETQQPCDLHNIGSTRGKRIGLRTEPQPAGTASPVAFCLVSLDLSRPKMFSMLKAEFCISGPSLSTLTCHGSPFVLSLSCHLLIHTFCTNSIMKSSDDWQPLAQLVCNLLLMKADEGYIKAELARSRPNYHWLRSDLLKGLNRPHFDFSLWSCNVCSRTVLTASPLTGNRTLSDAEKPISLSAN